MTANEFYQPAYVGGVINAVQISVTNNSNSTVTGSSRNGVYYVYQGMKFKLMDIDGLQISAGTTETVSKELQTLCAIPSTDIKLMVDTGGLNNCVVNVQIMWGV